MHSLLKVYCVKMLSKKQRKTMLDDDLHFVCFWYCKMKLLLGRTKFVFSHVQSCRQRHASFSQTPFKMIFWDNSHCFCCQSPTVNLQPWSHGMALSSTQLLLWTGGRDVLCRIDAQKDPNQNSGLKKLCGKVKCTTSILAQIGVWLGRWDGDTTCPLLGVVLFPKQVYFLPGFQRSKNCSGLRHCPYAALHFFKFLRGGWGPLLH